MEKSKPEIHLKLGVNDLVPAFKAKPPTEPRFYHFIESKTAKEFHDATLITYTRPDGSEYVMKDLYSRRK